MVDLKGARERLEAMLASLTQRNEKITGSLRRERAPAEGKWRDDAQLRENDEVLEVLDADGTARVGRIRAALARLDAGTYGACVRCDEPIAAARLEALPETGHCIECAAQAEQEGRGHE